MNMFNSAKDRFVAQRISLLTECRPEPIAPELDQFADWVPHFVTRQVFTAHVADEKVPLAFAMLRRIRNAVAAFDGGCALLASFVRERRMVDYFDCLDRFEAAILSISFARDIGSKALGTKLFTKGDGSDDERLHWLYNVIKHNEPSTIPTGHLHALWLENGGIHGAQIAGGGIDSREITFDELRFEIAGHARLAQKIVSGPLVADAPG